MRILITGATGLIGTALSKLLLKDGHEVHYLTINKKEIVRKDKYHGFFWDPSQGIVDENAFLGVDAIIHLAGATISKRWTTAYKQEIIESRIASANTLYKALKENPHQVRQIVSASAIGIYPNSPIKVYTEDFKGHDDSFLGNVVVKWEQSVDKFQQLHIKVCKIRTGVVFAKQGGALQEMIKPIKFRLGAAFGSGKQVTSWIHLHDIANLYRFAVTQQLEGTFNAVTPHPITNEALTKMLAKKLHKPLFLPNIPRFIMKLMLGEMHNLLFSDQNVSAQKILDNGFAFKFPKPEEALSDIIQ